jgi:hypothetical protein
LLFELISGRKPIERLSSGAKRTITKWTEPLIARCRLGDLIDLRLTTLYMRGEPDRCPNMRMVIRMHPA